MRAQAADYPLGIALSGPGGEYIVADTLKLSNRAGAEDRDGAERRPGGDVQPAAGRSTWPR